MKKRVGLVVTVLALVFTTLGAGVLFAAGGGGPRIPFLGSNVELHVASPFVVTPVWSGTTIDFKGDPVTVYPGQRIAEGVLRIENRSPLDHGAYLQAEPQKVLSETLPHFEVKAWVGNTLFHSPKVIPAGTTVEMRIEVFIPYGAPVSSFRGLDVIVDAGPPPTQTVADCPADGCG